MRARPTLTTTHAKVVDGPMDLSASLQRNAGTDRAVCRVPVGAGGASQGIDMIVPATIRMI